MILADILLAARLDSQFMDDNDHIICRQSKVISTKVSVDTHNRFNLLAEYLFESRLSESFTSFALLRDITEQLLSGYHDGLVGYEKLQSLSNTRIQEHN